MAIQVITIQLPGSPGPAGALSTLSIGTITTGAPGSQATASLTGAAPNQILNLTLPAGPQGAQGIQGPQGVQGPAGTAGARGADGTGIQIAGQVATYSNLPNNLTSADAGKGYIVTADGKLYVWSGTAFPANGSGSSFVGPAGPANTLAIGTTTTLAAGSSATASVTGTSPNQTLNLSIPQGAIGATGAVGPAGPANTLAIGTVGTGPAAASITGTAPNQTLNLTLPQGIQGATGATGAAGPGVIAGGASGSVLQKNSATDYDTIWAAPQSANVASSLVKRDSSGNAAFQRIYVDAATVPAVANEVTPKNYVDAVAANYPVVAAGSNVSVSSVKTNGVTTYTVNSTATGGGGTSTDADFGVVSLDSFAGANDDAKLAAAMSAVAADTYPRTIQLTNRQYSFATGNLVPFDGLRIQGPSGYGNPERSSQTKMPGRVALSMSGPWISAGTGTYYSVSLHNLSFTGGSGATILGGTSGQFYCLSMRDIFSSGLYSVLGTQANKLLLTAASFTGDWEINNCYTGAFHLGGSDNVFWSDGMLLDSGTAYLAAQSATGQHHLWLDGMDKSTVGPLYITAEGGWGGIRVSGPAFNSVTTNMGNVSVTGARIEGRNPGAGSDGALVRIDGGGLILRDCHINYGMVAPSSNGHSPVDAGIIHHAAGQLLVTGCTYDRANSIAESVPFVYTNTSADCLVNSIRRASRAQSWAGRPVVAKPTANAENRIVDGTVTNVNV